jgi:hypothetical protein
MALLAGKVVINVLEWRAGVEDWNLSWIKYAHAVFMKSSVAPAYYLYMDSRLM